MSINNHNRRAELPALGEGRAVLLQEIDAPDGSGTYVMVGVMTPDGRLAVMTPYRSIEAFAAACTKQKNIQKLTQGTAAEGIVV